MFWTSEQQKVIDLRNRNILVSAAAGSGKTAVLVERIISMITEGDNPIDIDRLLIVTFTNAAAAEMRERIGEAIEKKIADMPDNIHLQKQVTLVHSAQITTIHSFCLSVIRNHFNTIDLDPSFRIADEAELTLMKSDVISDLLETYYEEGREEFLDFIESFSSGKSDGAIEELILRIFNFSMSYPWPEEWLEEKKENFTIGTREEMKSSDWMGALLKYLKTVTKDLVIRCQDAIRICEEADGPGAYIPALKSDETLLLSLLELNDYDDYSAVLNSFSFARLSGKKEEGVSDEKKNQVKAIRDELKKAIGDLCKNYFFQSTEEMLNDIKAMGGPVSVLINLCKDFSAVFAKRKSEKNIVDFHDLEHFALNILVQKIDGEMVPTPAADELCEHYAEIMIDEYQDSNLVQETILNSICRERYGNPNLFMVGDVKQSIYRFRLARPEIFMEKYDTYDLEDSKHQRIDLHKNFRSRAVVLDSINFIFEQIMTKKLGNILYDEKAALYPGADFGEQTEGVSVDTEVILVSVEPAQKERDGEILPENESGAENDTEENEYTAKEIEARAIAKRMKELTDPEKGLMVFDKKDKIYRRARYGDIVILLRTMSNWAEIFADTFAAEGITSHTETQSGYFSTLEIRTVLNLLKIIDNPRQDIPFTAILRSPIVDLTSNDLALIRILRRRISMYEAVQEYSKEMSDELSGKLEKFMVKLDQYRDMVVHYSIHELILKVLEDTGYYNYVAAMPAGEKRRANIDMLVQRAIRFEGSSYSGLFHFVRYIEKLHKYDVDFGEAKIAGENDNTVKIMSIHKSKGLEFPIVFVAGMGKNFNNQDSRSNLLIHPDLGIGIDYVDHNLRIKAPTLVKKVIQKELVLENLGEELRVLYVAMTRAKEKLILTGGIKDPVKLLVKWSNTCRQKEKQLLYYQLSNAASYLDFVIPSLMRYRGFEEILKENGIRQDLSNSLYNADTRIVIKQYSYEQAAEYEYMTQLYNKVNQDDFKRWNTERIFNEEVRKAINTYMEYKYPYQTETNIHTKLTVSELKRLSQYEAEDFGVPVKGTAGTGKEFPVPEFSKDTDITRGADLGTLYHTVLEALDLTQIKCRMDIEEILLDLVHKGKIRETDKLVLDIDKLYSFTFSSVAERMRKAAEAGKLYKERQFVMGLKACEINSSLKSEETVLVQGVIDVYFEEDGKWILLDYKTDVVNGTDGEEQLIRRYRVQLDYYQKALEQLTGKKVKERILYSFGLGKEIHVKQE
ncbi:helicase-exonuclease AddAB subunit AddA [Anaerocolumna sedimenticola]|uniref:ATP-dependent helicase/nuclease subunit A n=1 Tax=Anaerocolumna sedimenticola TaxID=2696063 RepID=A0A6P1TJ40_9FIRM|nr:helicase-exonuclease AddAB subunit AddA [Anaerocolumna sedimenticola]QHQ59655.1 helicase-exonuclease AddAB subunit AddA [Anaerocolumna sedimenticola]